MVVFQNDKAGCGTSHPLKSLGSKATGGRKNLAGVDQMTGNVHLSPGILLKVIKPLEKKTVKFESSRRYRF